MTSPKTNSDLNKEYQELKEQVAWMKRDKNLLSVSDLNLLNLKSARLEGIEAGRKLEKEAQSSAQKAIIELQANCEKLLRENLELRGECLSDERLQRYGVSDLVEREIIKWFGNIKNVSSDDLGKVVYVGDALDLQRRLNRAVEDKLAQAERNHQE